MVCEAFLTMGMSFQHEACAGSSSRKTVSDNEDDMTVKNRRASPALRATSFLRACLIPITLSCSRLQRSLDLLCYVANARSAFAT